MNQLSIYVHPLPFAESSYVLCPSYQCLVQGHTAGAAALMSSCPGTSDLECAGARDAWLHGAGPDHLEPLTLKARKGLGVP